MPFLTPLQLLFLFCTSDQHNNLFIGPYNEHFYQFLFQSAQWFQSGRLKRYHTLFDTFGTSDHQKNHKLFRGPSNEHYCQVWFRLTQWFQKKIKKHLWASCLFCVLPSNKKDKLFSGPFNEHSYNVWFLLAQWF